MVIQCTSCQTKYRLNLERIPNRKTFVKCRNCGTPIYIDPPADSVAAAAPAVSRSQVPPAQGPEEGALPSAPAAAGAATPVVTCPGCATRYRVPGEALARPRVRLKCTQCGHVFAPGAPGQAAPVQTAEAARAAPRAPAEREFFPEAGGEPEPRAQERERPMPIPDETALEGMFDDLRDKASPFAARRAAPPPPRAPTRPALSAEAPQPDWEAAAAEPEPAAAMEAAEPELAPLGEPEPAPLGEPEPGEVPESLFDTDLERLGEQAAQAAAESRRAAPEFDPERAYREAVSLDDEDLPGRSKAMGSVPDEQKYRFFLKPGGEAGAARPAAPPPARIAGAARAEGLSPRAPAPEAPVETLGSVPGAGEEEIFPPPARAVPETGAEPVDLDALAGAIESEAPAEPMLDDVEALLKEHGIGEEPSLPEIPAAPAEPPRRAAFPLPLALAGAGSPRRERLLLAGVLGLAAGVLVLLFFLGYALG